MKKILTTTDNGYRLEFGDTILDLDHNVPSEAIVIKFASDLEYAQNTLAASLKIVRSDAERALDSVERGMHVNPLGVFQSSAVNADREAALLDAAINSLKMAIWALKQGK